MSLLEIRNKITNKNCRGLEFKVEDTVNFRLKVKHKNLRGRTIGERRKQNQRSIQEFQVHLIGTGASRDTENGWEETIGERIEDNLSRIEGYKFLDLKIPLSTQKNG